MSVYAITSKKELLKQRARTRLLLTALEGVSSLIQQDRFHVQQGAELSVIHVGEFLDHGTVPDDDPPWGLSLSQMLTLLIAKEMQFKLPRCVTNRDLQKASIIATKTIRDVNGCPPHCDWSRVLAIHPDSGPSRALALRRIFCLMAILGGMRDDLVRQPVYEETIRCYPDDFEQMLYMHKVPQIRHRLKEGSTVGGDYWDWVVEKPNPAYVEVQKKLFRSSKLELHLQLLSIANTLFPAEDDADGEWSADTRDLMLMHLDWQDI